MVIIYIQSNLILCRYSRKVNPVNKVIFAWWGAEEIGLIGSRYFVRDLKTNNPDKFSQIAGNLNFDMLASPNYGLLV